MKKCKSAPHGNSGMIPSQRRSERLRRKCAPKYQCDISSDESESYTPLVVKTTSCKRATYSRKTSTKNENSGDNSLTLITEIMYQSGNENSIQQTKRFANATTSKVGTNEPMLNCDPNNAKEMLFPIWWGSLSIPNENFGNVDVCVACKSTRLSSDAFHVVCRFPTLLPVKVIPRHDVWPNCFDTSLPTDDIIDFYILPGSESSDNQDFSSLLDYLHAQDLAMTIAVYGTRFLLFSSHNLPHKYWRHEEKYYLWVVIIGVNAFFPLLEECPDSTGLLNAQGKRSFEGSPPIGRATMDEGPELVFSMPDEIFIPNAVEILLSSDNFDGGNIQRTDSCSPILPRQGSNSGVQGPEEKTAYSKSFYTSFLSEWIHNLEGDSFDEVTSAAGSGELVGQYYVKPSVASTLRAVFEKHGDIAQNCHMISRGLVTFVLERICEVVQDFQTLEPKNLRLHHLNTLKAVISEGEFLKADVKWLKILHEELCEVGNKMKEYRKIRNSKRSKAKEIESKKTELMKLQSQVQSLEMKISTLENDKERLDSDLYRAGRPIKLFHSHSIMHGFL
ncbi:uncharacterized protein LOC133804625 [Humulus lupulus]|uniref:uncharacterized protein LOC133804625 n=1 Tax=Humulus lupulus TaxID=3486 RepID=UPI002B409C58|nr:uncharacterized protein LOC133804625 [Humulus lupulus]